MNARSSLRRVFSVGIVTLLLSGTVGSGVATAMPLEASALLRITSLTATPSVASRLAGPKRVVIRYRLSATARVTLWISGPGGTSRTLAAGARQGAGQRTAVWNLRTASGAWAPNGIYTVNIRGVDSAGHVGTPNPARITLRLDATAPAVSLSGLTSPTISPLVGETSSLTFRTVDNVPALPLRATLEVVPAAGGTRVRSIVQTGIASGVTHTFTWDGRDTAGSAAAPGVYALRVRVADTAGNEGLSTPLFLHVNAWGAERILDLTPHYDAVTRADARDERTHVVWNDAVSDTVRYRRLDAYGNTLVGPVTVASAVLDGDLTRGVPDVAADAEGAAYVVWRGPGRSSSYRAIWLARVAPSGRLEWTYKIAEDPTYGTRILDPRITCGPDGLAHVVCWQEGTPTSILYATFRRDGMSAIGWTAVAGGRAGQRRLPNVAVDPSGRVHIVWYDAISHGLNLTRKEIHYARLAYAAGNPVSVGSIAGLRITDSEPGLGPDQAWAPELAADSGGSAHVVWADKRPSAASKGISYARVSPSGALAVSPRRIIDGSVNSPGKPYYGNTPVVVALPDGGARVIARASWGTTGPRRLWQADVRTTGIASDPILVTDGRNDDMWPSVCAGADGSSRLVYLGDTNELVGGSDRQRITYKDLAVEPAANDYGRPDLQVDSAHWTSASTPAHTRQGSAVRISAEIRNAGWVACPGGLAVLEHEGVAVDTAELPSLPRESVHTVEFDWSVPQDATRTPAALVIRVAPSTGTTQTCSANDSAGLPVHFAVPPDRASLLLDVFDETDDPERAGFDSVRTAVAALAGTTADGAPYSSSGQRIGGWVVFRDVPLGTYTLVHSAPGYIVSPPSPQTVTIARDPSDRYELVVSPGLTVPAWVNRWGTIDGVVTESGGTTPVAGVAVTAIGSGATSTTPHSGTFRLGRLRAGVYRVKATKAGWARAYAEQTVAPATTHTLTIPLTRTTLGYLAGTVFDEAGVPAIGDPDLADDDPVITIRDSAGVQVRRTALHDGSFDFELPAGSYRLDFEAPGYLRKSGLAATIRAGVETDESVELELDVSGLSHVRRSERWLAAWTAHSQWGGDQPPSSKIETFDVYQWFGLARFTLDADYQDVGLNRYIRLVKPVFTGEAWDWHYIKAWKLFGVDTPVAPVIFTYAQPPISGAWEGKCQPPMLIPGSTWNRTGIRVDGVDIVDQRDGSVVSAIRSQWDSCAEQEGHQYGSIGDIEGDGAFGTYSHPVPWDQQLVRFWMTVGTMDPETGTFSNSAFDDISRLNMLNLFQATGSSRLAMSWRPSDNAVFVEPALFRYPEITP